jgi:hypothetical protein
MTNSFLSKSKQLFFAFTFTLVTLFTFNSYSNSQNTNLLSSCMVVESKLPMNHINHPCQAPSMSNKSWLSWLSGESQSTHLHFVDLVELIHYSFH